MTNENDTNERLEVSWSYTFSLPSGRSTGAESIDAAADADSRTSYAYYLLACQLEEVAARHGALVARSVLTSPVKAYRFGGGLTDSVIQVLGAVGGVAGIAGLLKDFLPIIRDWKKSNRNLSVTLKRNGTEVTVSGAQTAAEASDLLKTSMSLATRKLPAPTAAPVSTETSSQR